MRQSDDEGGSRGRGRPVDLDKRAAIREATRELLAEVGYSSLTIEGVASRAGSNRNQIYRGWGDKVRLVADVILTPVDDLGVPDRGSAAADLRAVIEQRVSVIAQPAYLRGFPGLLVDFVADRELSKEVADRFGSASKSILGAVVERHDLRDSTGEPVDIALLDHAINGAALDLAITGTARGDALVDALYRLVTAGFVGRIRPT